MNVLYFMKDWFITALKLLFKLFQAAKILYGREYFTRMNPPAAKKEGRRVDLRDDWEDVKMGVMYDVCYAKFAYNPELKKKLLKTGDKHLEEANHHGDMIWGTVDGEGENNLGKILMQKRLGGWC